MYGHACRVFMAATLVVALIAAPGDLLAFKAMDDISSMDGGTADAVTRSVLPDLESIHIRGIHKAAGTDVPKAALDLVEQIMGERFKGADPPFQARLRMVQKDNLGFQHIRLAQTYKGLPVVGAELIVHVNARNIAYLVNGKFLPPVRIATEPSIDASAALQTGLADLAGKPDLQVIKQPSLVIFASRLAYHFVISHGGDTVGQWYYYVDALAGEILQKYNNIMSLGPSPDRGESAAVSGYRLEGEDGSHVTMAGWLNNRGIYFLYSFDEMWGVFDEDRHWWERNGTSEWGTEDQAAVSAGNNFSLTQNWVKSALGRSSFDGAGAFARANVHTRRDYANAYWDGTDFHFGDGDGYTATPLTTLDVIAHEYGHALTQYSSNLIYYGESGALNESFSDITAAAVEFANQPNGTASYPSANAGESDWLIGEDTWVISEALRDMRDPQRYGQPSYYQGTYWYFGSADNAGVHTNSGVQNFAFYLLAEGGAGTNDGHPYNVVGTGVSQATEIAMQANIYYISDSASHADARQAWIDAAQALGYNVSAVEAAWSAVGVQ